MFTDLPVSVSPNSELILGESFRRFCKRSRLDLSCGTQRDVLVLCAGGGDGGAPRAPFPPLIFPRQTVILRKAHAALCAGPTRRKLVSRHLSLRGTYSDNSLDAVYKTYCVYPVSPNSELILVESFRRFCKRSRLDFIHWTANYKLWIWIENAF
jgi:hypothetical protein